ncbi:MAG: DUF3160 domain-containing protein [Tissierellia bacterium]|nr:DUF3160 domain-containing protein [Tissierellia bacterium]
MKKKKLVSIISILLALSILISGCNIEKVDTVNPGEEINEGNAKIGLVEEPTKINISVDYKAPELVAKVKSYKLEADLSNIVNLDQFGEFSKEQLELLKKNNFVVNPTKQQQLFYIYEDNDYKHIPSFITTDSVLQVYHIFYDYSLRKLEEEALLGLIEELTDNMLKNSIDIYNKIENKDVKEMQLKNIAFFATGQLALEKNLPGEIPVEAREMALKEQELINAHGGFSRSHIFPYDLDYSQFTIRGHYTRTEDFGRYFKAMMWYGLGPFPLYFEENKERNIEQTIQALLITYSICTDKDSYEIWEKIYELTNFFVGSADDLNIYHYGQLLVDIYGKQVDLNELNDKEKLDEFYKAADKLPEPRIKGKYTSVNTPVGKQFRFMGQRYVMDGEIIQDLVEPIIRPIPSGLDVMGVLGSDRAKEIQISKEENKYWEDYPKRVDDLRDKFAKLSENEWQANMYTGWLWVLKGFLEPFGDGYPSFMTNDAWLDKDLNTALGSWSELKHDTVLYGKQSGAEMGGDVDIDLVVGYVEPNIEVYEKLLWLTRYSRKNLKAKGVDILSIDNSLESFEWLLEFLINCSIKELNNEELTEDEYDWIKHYGGLLESLTSSFAGDGIRWFEITSETDKNMAIIADFHTIAPNQFSDGGYMEAGVGPAYEIYVVVPIGGKLYLTRGGVFSYHEFISTGRLTDEEWQLMIEMDMAPPMPEWTQSFIREGKGEIPFPEF